MKLSLTNQLFLAIMWFLSYAASAQMYIGTRFFVGDSALVSIQFSGTTPVLLHDTLANLGTVRMDGVQLMVNSTGRLFNESSMVCNPQIAFNGGEGENRNGSLLASSEIFSFSGNSRFINRSNADTLFSGLVVQLNGTSELTNQGIVYTDSLNLTNQSVFINDSSAAVRYDVVSTFATTVVRNNGLLRIGRSFINQGGYGLATDTGTVVLGDTTGVIRTAAPIYRLIIRASASGAKTLEDSLRISKFLTLQNGPIVTSAFAIRLDSSARITRPTFFNPVGGGRVIGTIVRQQEYRTAPVTDSLYFPVGTALHFTPTVVRNMTGTGPLPLFVVSSLNPSLPGTGSYDVSRVFNNDFGWRFEAVPPQDSIRVLLAGPFAGGLDTLIVAQSGSASGVYESLGVSDTASGVGLQKIITSDFTPDKPFLSIGSSQNLKLSLKVYLQGRQKLFAPFDLTFSDPAFTNTLNTRFASQVLETYRPIPNTVVDSISISIRNVPSGAALETIPAWLMADGSIRDFRTLSDTFVTFSRQPVGSFYIVINHRNHLSLMTHTPVSLSRTPSALADLTQIANVSGGGAYLPTLSGNHAAMYNGNAVNDLEVNALDQFAVLVLQSTLPQGYLPSDVNLDNVVNADDLSKVDEGSINLYFSTVP